MPDTRKRLVGFSRLRTYQDLKPRQETQAIHSNFLVYFIVMRIIGKDNHLLFEIDFIDENIMPDVEPPTAVQGFS